MALPPKKHRRRARLFKIRPRSHPIGEPYKTGPAVAMRQVIGALQVALKKGPVASVVSAPTAPGIPAAPIRLLDIVITPKGDFATLLLATCDPAASDQEKEHISTGAIQTLTIGKGEGLRRGAHLVIKLDQAAGDKDVYRCVLEEMEHLSRSQIIEFLERVAKNHIAAVPPQLVHRDRKKKIDVDCELALRSLPEKAKSLIDALNDPDSELIGFEFVRQYRARDIDDLRYEEALEVVKVKLEPGDPKALEKALKIAKRSFKGFKTLFINEKGKHRKVPVRLDKDLSEALFSENVEMSGFTIALPSIYNAVLPEMTDRLIKIGANDEHWRQR